MGPWPGCPGATGPGGLHLERPFPKATAPTKALVSAGLKEGLFCRSAGTFSGKTGEHFKCWSCVGTENPREEFTCTFCIPVITRVVELLQQIWTQFVQRLDLFLLLEMQRGSLNTNCVLVKTKPQLHHHLTCATSGPIRVASALSCFSCSSTSGSGLVRR